MGPVLSLGQNCHRVICIGNFLGSAHESSPSCRFDRIRCKPAHPTEVSAIFNPQRYLVGKNVSHFVISCTLAILLHRAGRISRTSFLGGLRTLHCDSPRNEAYRSMRSATAFG